VHQYIFDSSSRIWLPESQTFGFMRIKASHRIVCAEYDRIKRYSDIAFSIPEVRVGAAESFKTF